MGMHRGVTYLRKEELEMQELQATHLHNQKRKREKKENGQQAMHKRERGENGQGGKEKGTRDQDIESNRQQET